MERWTLEPARFRRLAILTVVLLCVLVVAGGVVRLTGSGLGCDDWPNCNDTSFIDVSSGHAAIEQLNRIFSALIGIPVLLLAIGSFRVRPRRPGLVAPSLGVLVTVLGNGVVGGLAVRGDLNPAIVQSHFLLTMASIAFGLVVVRRAGDRPSRPVEDRAGRLVCAAIGVATVVALVTGTVVTGTGPHAGEEDVRRFDFDIDDTARVHSLSVLAAAMLVVTLIVLLGRSGERARFEPILGTWMFVAIVQGLIGYVQYFNGVPAVLVGVHLAGATLFWVVTVQLMLDGLGHGARRSRPPAGDRDHAGVVVG